MCQIGNIIIQETLTYTRPKYIRVNFGLKIWTKVIHGLEDGGCVRLMAQRLNRVITRLMQTICTARLLRTRHKRGQDRPSIKRGQRTRAHDATGIALRLLRYVVPISLPRPIRDGRQGNTVVKGL